MSPVARIIAPGNKFTTGHFFRNRLASQNWLVRRQHPKPRFRIEDTG
jgi:hypothetical protein